MDFTKLKKLEPEGADTRAEPHGVVSAIVKVKEAGYRPPGVRVRAEISPHLFTADCDAGQLPALEADPGVESVSVSQRLPLQKPGY